MTKVILKSLFVIVALLTISAGTTNAYFSDSKVVTGNVFSTGTWEEEPPEPKKVDICHLENKDKKKKERYHLISISINALDAHLAHGDEMPGTMVNDVWFAEDCSMWVLVDTVNVPGDNGVGVDSVVLTEDTEYLFKTSGTYTYATWAGDPFADAKFSYRGTADPLGYSGEYLDGALLPGSYKNFLQVWVDYAPVDWQGDYDASNHEYTLSWTGDGTSVHFYVEDGGAYGDNTFGDLSVAIFKLVN